MSLGNNCSVRSVVLQPNEDYILPPGAIIIGATDVSSIDSVCADLTDIEEFECFGALMGTHTTKGTDFDSYWEGDSANVVKFEGYEFNGVKTLFNTPVDVDPNNLHGCLDGPLICTTLMNNFQGILSATPYRNNTIRNGHDNCMTFIVIKTIPSIGNNLKLILSSTGQGIAPESKVEVFLEFKPIADYSSYLFVNGVDGSGSFMGDETCPPDPGV